MIFFKKSSVTCFCFKHIRLYEHLLTCPLLWNRKQPTHTCTTWNVAFQCYSRVPFLLDKKLLLLHKNHDIAKLCYTIIDISVYSKCWFIVIASFYAQRMAYTSHVLGLICYVYSLTPITKEKGDRLNANKGPKNSIRNYVNVRYILTSKTRICYFENLWTFVIDKIRNRINSINMPLA